MSVRSYAPHGEYCMGLVMLSFTKKSVKLKDEEYAYLDMGKGAPILFIHGNMSSGVHYLPAIERLQDSYRCIALDLRGFGDSSYNTRFDSMYELADDVVQFMDALKLDKVPVVAWSAGGAVALSLATRTERVEKLFLIEGASHKGYPIYKKKKDFTSDYGNAYADKEELALDSVQVAPMLNIFATNNAVSMTGIWNNVIYTVNKPETKDNDVYMSETMKERCLVDLDWALATFNMSDKFSAYGKGDNSIKNITCPVALTMADKDCTVPDWMVMENVNALEGCKLIPYNNCGHSPMVDCPDRVAQDIKEFIG